MVTCLQKVMSQGRFNEGLLSISVIPAQGKGKHIPERIKGDQVFSSQDFLSSDLGNARRKRYRRDR